MVRSGVVVVLALVLAGPVAAAPPDMTPAGARDRVDHHLRHAEDLTKHFEEVLAADCPHFTSSRQWTEYVDGEVDRVVLLLAHLEQAWVEAKRTSDDDVRRTAKAPRRRLESARALVDKLQGCADDNGERLVPTSLWRRIERDVPKRQAEITLPD